MRVKNGSYLALSVLTASLGSPETVRSQVSDTTVTVPSSTIPAQPLGEIGAAAGSGAWPAIAESRSDLPGFTLYRPKRLSNLSLPLLVWGNGGCRDNGLIYANFLREIASHGYIVIALGHPREERAINLPNTRLQPEPRPARNETLPIQMIQAIDWATAETSRKNAPLHGNIDVTRIGLMGHSCGAIQAIGASADPRVTTSIVFNSGVHQIRGTSEDGWAPVFIDQLDEIHAPIAFFIGGPRDYAQIDPDNNFDLINAPAFIGNLDTGHSGTFWDDESGGEWSRVAIHWLDWQLKGDSTRSAMFRDIACALCRDSRWETRQKGLNK